MTVYSSDSAVASPFDKTYQLGISAVFDNYSPLVTYSYYDSASETRAEDMRFYVYDCQLDFTFSSEPLLKTPVEGEDSSWTA